MASLELRTFNPVACSMTKRKAKVTSPSAFLLEDSQAREFWEYVDLTNAYQYHHAEKRVHSVAFIDTLKLMSHELVRERLVHKLTAEFRLRLGRRS